MWPCARHLRYGLIVEVEFDVRHDAHVGQASEREEDTQRTDAKPVFVCVILFPVPVVVDGEAGKGGV